MKILKKIFATLLLLIFSLTITNANLNYDDTSYYKKQVISAKKELAIDYKFSKYISKIDKVFEKIWNDKEKLEKLQTKINDIELKIYQSKNLKKYSRYLKLLNYLSAKVSLYLYKLNKKLEDKKELESKNKLEEMNNSNLSENDKKLVEKKLVNIQLSLLDNAKWNFDSLLKDFDKLTNYEEKWNMKLNYQIDLEVVWKLKAEISVNNYTSKNSWFNTDFSGKIKALIDASLKWQEAFKLELNTFVNYISKDGNIYLLLKDLNIVNNNNEKQIKELISKVKEIASKNKYIKFEDKNTKQALKLIKNINPKKNFSDWEELLKRPLLTAYKKEWQKYYLIPTKYACEKYKEIAWKFDPWNWNTCSDSQYKDMLKELSKAWNITLEIWDKNKLSFVAIPSYWVKSFNSEIIFTDKNIESIHSELIAEKKWEWFELSYIKNNKLTFYLNAWKEANIDFKSTLDNNNKFSSIDFTMNTKWYEDDFNAKLKIENKKITWGFESNYKQYDWNTWKSEQLNTTANISGNQNYNKQLENISFSINWKNKTQNKKTFSSNISLKNKKISWKTVIFDKQEKEYIKITNTWKYDTNFLELNNKIELAESPIEALVWSIDKARDIKRISDLYSLKFWLEQYYQETLEYPTTIKWNKDLEVYFGKVLPTETLWNVEINGCKYGYYYEVWKDKNWIENQVFRLSSCMETKDKLIIKSWLIPKDFKTDKEFYIEWYTTWTKKEAVKKLENQKVEANINFDIDVRNNKNNANIFINYKEDKKEILRIEIDNKWTINYKKVEIKTPTNIIDSSELNLAPKY